MAKINLGKYTQEDATFGTTNEAAMGMLKHYDAIESIADKAIACSEDVDKMFEDGEKLLALTSEYEQLSAGDTLTPREVQLLIQQADSITASYSGLDEQVYTQEDAELDPRGTLMKSKEDKRGIGRKMIDAAKKGIVKMIAMFRKAVAKTYAYFSVSADAAKNLKEEVQAWEKEPKNTWPTGAVLSTDEVDDMFDRNIGALAAAYLMNTTYNVTSKVGGMAEHLSKSIVFDKIIQEGNTLSVKLTDTDIPSGIDEDKDYSVMIASVSKDKLSLLFVQKDTSGDYDVVRGYLARYEADEDNLDRKGLEKVLSSKELNGMLDFIHTRAKDTGKSIDKKFKEVTEVEKLYDKAAKAMKSDPSNSVKGTYDSAYSMYKTMPKIAFRQAMDMVSAIKTGILDAEAHFDAVKKAGTGK